MANTQTDFRTSTATARVFHPLFQRIAVSRSRYEVEDLLNQEAAIMSAFLREAWHDDTNNLIRRDDLLPFAAYNANFRGDDGKIDAYVYYSSPRSSSRPGRVARTSTPPSCSTARLVEARGQRRPPLPPRA